MPQLAREGIENSGTSRPACRPRKKSRGIDAILYQLQPAREQLWPGQQADNDIRFMSEIEKVTRVNDDAIALEKLEDEALLGARGWNSDHGGPSSVGRQDRK